MLEYNSVYLSFIVTSCSGLLTWF